MSLDNNDADDPNEHSLQEFSFENDKWVMFYCLLMLNTLCCTTTYYRVEVKLTQRIRIFYMSKCNLLKNSREKDIKFTPLRRIINIFSILILLIGLGHIISSGKLIKVRPLIFF